MAYTKRSTRFRSRDRLTESEIREREAAAEFEKRHAGCEDDPCDECRGNRNFDLDYEVARDAGEYDGVKP